MLEYTRGTDDAFLPQCDGGDKLIRHLFTSLTTPIRAFLGALGAITSTNIRLQAHIAEALSRHGGDKLNTMRVPNGLGPIQALEWIAGGGSIQTQYQFFGVYKGTSVSALSACVPLDTSQEKGHHVQSLSLFFGLNHKLGVRTNDYLNALALLK